MRKILILGGNRFVGRQLASQLRYHYQVTVFNRTGTSPEGVEVIQGDRNNLEDLQKLKDISYDCVIDFCLFKPDQFELVKNVFTPNTKYIFISSAAVYSDKLSIGFCEKDLCEGGTAFSPYGLEKADCERAVLEYFFNPVILRPPYVDGENSHRPRLAKIFNQIINNQPVEVAGNGEYCFNVVWVSDFCNVVEDIVNTNFSILRGQKVLNLAPEEIFKMVGLVSRVGNFLKKDFKITYESTDCFYPDANLVLIPNILSKYFTTLEENLPTFYEWYKTNSKQKYGF